MNFYQLAYLGTNENFFLGIFHGALFSFPFSVPFLISCRYFIFHQWMNGFISLLGTLSGQILFFLCVSSGARPLIQFWYTVEPFLSFIGILLIFQIGTEFYHQNLRQLTIGHSEAIESSKQIDINSDSSGVGTTLRIEPGEQGVSIDRTFGGALDGLLRNQQRAMQSNRLSNTHQTGTSQRLLLERLFNFKIFFFQFFLIFCNPVFPALSTRILFNQDIFTQIGGFAAMYLTGFSIAGILSIFTFIYLIYFLMSCVRQVAVLGAKLTEMEFGVWSSGLRECVFARLLEIWAVAKQSCGAFGLFASPGSSLLQSKQSGAHILNPSNPNRLTSGGGLTASQIKLAKPYISQVNSEFFGPRGVNNFFVFCLLGLGLHGSLQYTWRFLTYYPLEFAPIGSRSAMNIIASETTEAKVLSLENGLAEPNQMATRLFDSVNPALSLREGSTGSERTPPPYKQGVLTRQFGTQDSSIRHREKTLPVERHLPIERINTRRTLSGRLPLKNEQKSDAYIKYNSFVFNKFENFIENIKIQRIDNAWNQLPHHGWIPFNMIERFNGISQRIAVKPVFPGDRQWVPRGIVEFSTDSRNQNVVTGEPVAAGSFEMERLNQAKTSREAVLSPNHPPVPSDRAGTRMQTSVASDQDKVTSLPTSTVHNRGVAIIGKEKHDTKGKPKFSYIRRLTNFLDPIFMNIGVSTIDYFSDSTASRQEIQRVASQTSDPLIKSTPQAVLGTPNQQEITFQAETGYLHDDFLVEFALLNFLD